ncbi:ABC transporter permease [Terriglobus albidus]|uniref:ABC transporter permease n=1 Tax=Terriglobus albidus TaxID=1592106 RepID=A0A5B9EE24_9BACT|nr:ABC transporter permease [Terriglobus albidus]QEE30282.1 ABC transporter permease [Terriglobus albidus]
MSWLRFFRRKRKDAELQDELDSFLSEEIAGNVARGMSPGEARRRARVKLGNSQQVRESLWMQNSPMPLTHLFRDLKYAFRTLRRTPGFSVIAIVVMALCMGAAISLFTIVRSVLLRPLPFRDPARLVVVYEHRRANGAAADSRTQVAPADFYDWRAKTHGFEDMAIIRYAGYNLTGERNELPESVRAATGSWNLFQLLGVKPAFGRAFSEQEDRPGSTAVMLSWSVFERRFAGDPAIVGRQIHLDGRPATVVGVLPSWFAYPDAGIQLWRPYQADATPEFLQHHDFHQSLVIARLRPGVSLASALEEVGAVQYQLHLQYPHDPVAEDVVPRSLNEDLAGNVKKPLNLMMSAVGCMLLIGCLNVSNLLVARGAARQKEVAIRSALGARRGTLIREQLAESVLICAAGCMGGIALSVAATRSLAHAWKDLPTAQGIYIDGTVIGFACLLMITATLIAGLLPALSTTGKAMMNALQASARTGASSVSRTVLRKTLLTTEIGITVVLLVSAGLLLKSFLRLRSTDVGCITQNMLTLSYSLPEKKYDTPEKRNAFNEALLERVRNIPGVHAAALGNTLPGAGYWGDFIFTVKEHPPVNASANLPEALTRWADPGYFSALGIPLVRGRFFTDDERGDRSYKVIVNSQLVRKYFPGEDPIGRHLHVPAHPHDGAPGIVDYEIVGVVGDTLYQVGKEPKAAMYFPMLEGTGSQMLAVHTTSAPLQFSIPIQRQIAALDPELPVSDVRTMDEVIGASLVNASLSARLVLIFAVLSLLLAAVGLYGVLSYLATQRTTELGIRMALGAQRDQLLRLMLGDGMRPALLGLGLGLAVSFVATRLFESMLFGTKPLDPVVISCVVGTLFAVAVLACLAPAWRASRLDPMQALRTD